MGRFRLENQEKKVIACIFVCFFVFIVLYFFEKEPFILATNDPETAREILAGVGVAGLSAIFAIVISVTLMAVQFTAMEYTHHTQRIMAIHFKSLTFIFVIVIYLGSILYNVFWLGQLNLGSESVGSNSKFVEISMLLTCLSLIMLIPYFFFTMIRLRPDSVISKLLAEIDEKYLNSIIEFFKGGEARIPGKVDKMLAITDIIKKFISSEDRVTARFSIDEIYRCYMSNLKKENEAYVSPYFLPHILGIGREAITKANDDSMVHVLEIFGNVGIDAIPKNLNLSARMSVECIDIIGFKVLENYDVATEQMIDSLQGMLEAIINSGNEEILEQIFTLYHDTSDELFKLKNYQMLKYIGHSFSELLDSMLEKKCYAIIERTAGLLESIGIFAVNLDTREVLHQSVHSLYKIGISSAKDSLIWETPKGTVIIAERIIDHLFKIEDETLKCKSKLKEFDSIINEIEFARKDIEKYREEEVDFSDLWR
jgi:hypothetical protein